MLIRDAAPADIPAITAIYADAVLNGTASYEIVPPEESEMRARFERIVAGGYPYLAAEADGGVLGYAYANCHKRRPGYRYLVEDTIYVAPEAQGRGVGRTLLNALIARCEAGPWRQMLGVIGGASPASIAVHEACGFRRVGRIEGSGHKDGRWLDTVLVQRALSGGTCSAPEGGA